MILRIILALFFVLGVYFGYQLLRRRMRAADAPLLPAAAQGGAARAGLVVAGVALLLLAASLLARGIGMAGGLFVLLAEALPYAFGALCFGLFMWWRARRPR